MAKRFVTIWFRHLITDWLSLKKPALKNTPFVFAAPDHGRMIITATNRAAEQQGITTGMAAADARALVPSLEVLDEIPGLPEKLLKALGEWCIRYTPIAAIELPDSLILDISGCAHLWGGERPYLKELVTRLRTSGYDVRAAMADTIGTAWAIARYGKITPLIEPGEQLNALLPLAPAALRLEPVNIAKLQKLGLHKISSFITMPRSVLRRRFGQQLLLRLDQALGQEEEVIQPILPVETYSERLPCLEPIRTATGIEIALTRLLEALCHHLQQKGKGLRSAIFTGYRMDGKVEQVEIGTNRASHNIRHLFKLFEDKITTIEPDLGIELFILEAPKVEDINIQQETLWSGGSGLDSISLVELLDRLAGKLGADCIHRYLPDEHYWPERSIKPAAALTTEKTIPWQTNRPRPMQLLARPEPIEVAAPIPDYPPMHFRYKGGLHTIKKADGPERIEREWWIEAGQHRDYYLVEDAQGKRYWLFRLGHYEAGKPMNGLCMDFLPEKYKIYELHRTTGNQQF